MKIILILILFVFPIVGYGQVDSCDEALRKCDSMLQEMKYMQVIEGDYNVNYEKGYKNRVFLIGGGRRDNMTEREYKRQRNILIIVNVALGLAVVYAITK